MSDKLYPVSESFRRQTLMDKASYQAWYQESLEQPDTFWRKRAEELVSWDAPFTQISDCDMAKGEANWFVGGKLNVSVNCIDRHLPTRGDQTAIIWEADEPGQHQYITYKELHREVCRFANVLKAQGIKKGDRVCIYMPMIPQAAYAMLACTRIGAIHSVVFGGFSPEALRDRIEDGQCALLITADEGRRGGRSFALKQNADIALAKGCESLKTCLVVKHTGGQIDWQAGRDIWLHDALQSVGDDCAPESMDAEDPLYILYTSGSTGKPKGVLHTTGGYLVNCALTHKYVFDYHEGEVYWCTADVGWVTGHSYILYGPLANGATTLMFEGVPTYPTASRCWQVVDTHQVNIFYTAPTAIRALMAQGDEFVTQTSRASLKLIGSVGEPINPEAWEWYHKVVGESRCPVVDTWWQTETGCIMIAPLPGATDQKPGSATLPLFGIEPVLMDDDGKEITGEGAGKLAIKRSWPSQIRSVYGNPQRMFDTYFSAYPGYYFSGDGARRDADGYFWITGRVDDVINVSGHRLGTAEIESALVLHAAVAEAAVVGYDHHIKGQAIYAYVDLIKGHAPSTALEDELRAMVAKEIGAFAKPELIQFVTGLPKTRSAKIMRRILRKIASNDIDNLGDTSTLADASVVTRLVDERKNR